MNLDTIRAICMRLPGVTEDIKWENHICFSVGGKMFFVGGFDHVPATASIKVPDEEFEEISARPGFKPAPYMARNKWVFVEDVSQHTLREWEHLLRQSYELIKAKLPKKLQRALDEAM